MNKLPSVEYYIGLASVVALCGGTVLLLATMFAALDWLVYLALGSVVAGIAGIIILILRSPRLRE